MESTIKKRSRSMTRSVSDTGLKYLNAKRSASVETERKKMENDETALISIGSDEGANVDDYYVRTT